MTENTNLVERTQHDILKYISEHPDCEKLPKEQEFVELLGVSRIVVREAMSRLKILGIIESKKKGGTRVSRPDLFGVVKYVIESGCVDKQTLKDMYQLRLIMEMGAADFIYKSVTPATLSKLKEIVDEGLVIWNRIEKEGLTKELYEQNVHNDASFHNTLIMMTGNESFKSFQGILNHLFSLYKLENTENYKSDEVISHLGLYNILKDGSADEFRMAMRLHFHSLVNSYEELVDTQ